MKIFVIVYVFGQIVAVQGPVPYDMKGCKKYLVEVVAHYRKKPKFREFNSTNTKIQCEYRKG